MPKSDIKNPPDLSEKAYHGIRQMLFHKEIVPGQKIAYRDIAKRLGMSPTPVIQALKWLEIQRLVRHETNRGYYLEPMDLREIEEIYDLRRLIEISLLPETLRRIDEKGVERLRGALKAHFNANRETYLNQRIIKDAEFHLTLASLARRRTQSQLLTHLFDLLCLKYRGGFLSATRVETTDSEHQEIFESVAARDLRAARKVLSHHILNVKRRVTQNFREILEERKQWPLYQV